MRSFYVDIEPNGEGWTRPCEIGWQESCDVITDSVNDYAGEYDRLRDDVIESDYPDMAAAKHAMNPRPELILPRWPNALANPPLQPAALSDS